tara:strand:- start:422 stop:544 length:123 start_codon:yes stop_codon:yes gene_type:complete
MLDDIPVPPELASLSTIPLHIEHPCDRTSYVLKIKNNNKE